MTRGSRGMLYAALGLIVIAAVGFWLFFYSPLPSNSNYTFDIDEIRRLSSQIEGELPERIESLQVGKGEFPGWFVVAGKPFAKFPIDWRTYQIVYSSGKRIIVDPTHDSALHNEFPFAGEYYEQNYQAMQQALNGASKILFTHEHWDHIGGVSRCASIDELADNIVITREQHESPIIEQAQFKDGYLDKLTPVQYDHYHAVAPGVVLIKAPGHTPGNQIIYVKTQTSEYIFAGDIAYNWVNFADEKGRSWFGSLLSLESPAARKQVGHQLRAIKSLASDKRIHVVLAHDVDLNNQLIANGAMTDTLTAQ